MNADQMENRVLRADNLKLVNIIENMKLQSEREKSIETFLCSALAGFCAQPRSAHDDYWEQDTGTGMRVPKEGGPKWAAAQAIRAMTYVVQELENIVNTQEPVIESSGMLKGIE